MNTSQLVIAVIVLTMLILIPLIVIVLVRWLIPLEDPVEEMNEITESDIPTNNLQDFWSALSPHLIELRDRLVKASLAIAIGTAIGFYMVNSPLILGTPLPDFMVKQLAPPGTVLQAVGVGEVFLGYMQIALIIGVIFAMPVVVYQLVAFFSPGLLGNEKRMVYIALPIITELFLAGVAFGWFFTVPAALQFLLQYGQTSSISTVPTSDSFFQTVATLLLWNGIIFQLPAVMYLLARLNIVSTGMLTSTRRYAIVVITIIAALITPTGDPYNLLLLAVPMYMLYELGIILTRFVPKPEVAALPE
ncbi:MAG: twin-arginine translocase subunit TatC [Chloroflexia bacterium]|nr:twin-arginine translocase subunit TatC [Chloroflexia bacterium]